MSWGGQAGGYEIDYQKVFKEDEQTSCTDHLNGDGFGGLKFAVISPEFKAALELTNGKDLLYEHYVCKICGFPDKFYVRFCYYCEGEFYGVQRAIQCIPCSKKNWSV